MRVPPNVLPDAFIALLVYGLIQLGKSLIPASNRWPNNAIRAIGYALTYLMVVVNRLVMGPVHWPDLWGLLPVAAALYGGAALLFHVQDNAAPVSTEPSSSAAQVPVQARQGDSSHA